MLCQNRKRSCDQGFFDQFAILQSVPMNRGGVGARSLNIELQAALNPASDNKVERFGWVTRGKKLVVLVGQKKAVAIAVRNVSGRRRWSKLQEWLRPNPTLARQIGVAS
jgi:ATP-dependent exoDNAse (exonuclease V) alpha subunit